LRALRPHRAQDRARDRARDLARTLSYSNHAGADRRESRNVDALRGLKCFRLIRGERVMSAIKKSMIVASIMSGAMLLTTPNATAGKDRPVALVEYIADAPAANVGSYDYLFDGDKVDLRPNGQMVIAFFDNCIVETFLRGVVKIRDEAAKATKGGSSSQTVRPCQTAALALSARATEAGAAVKRQDKAGSLLAPEAIKEVTVAVERPTFVWPRERARENPVSVKIHYLEAEPKTVIWETETIGAQLPYPEDAPALERGMPYEVVVSFKRGDDLTAVFSIDPGLELPVSPLSRVIPLGL